MPIRYRCPSCGQLLGISSKMAGREFPCPKCGEASIVPGAREAEELTSPPLPPSAEGLSDVAQAGPLASRAEDREFPVLSEVASREVEEEDQLLESNDLGAGDEDADSPVADDGAFQIHRRSLESDEMDLTPMVDMTFLLLIFFMITASFSVQKSIAFPPPSPEQKGAVQTTHTLEDFENSSVVVRIDDRNAIYVDDEPVPNPGRLVDVLKAALSIQRNEIILTADDNALHETVVAVIDAANAAGMQRIRLASRGADE